MAGQSKGRRGAVLPPRQAEPAGMVGEMLGRPTFLDAMELNFVASIDGYARRRGTITEQQGTAIERIYEGFRGRLGKDGARVARGGASLDKNG